MVSNSKNIALLVGVAVVSSAVTWGLTKSLSGTSGNEPLLEVAEPTVVEAVEPAPAEVSPALADGLKATYWAQRSAEYEATVEALYDLARKNLDEALEDPTWSAYDGGTDDFADKPPAVILDVDETVLNHAELQAWGLMPGNRISRKTLYEFFDEAKSPAIKPALAFTKYAASRGVKVFYVTNRLAPAEEATRRNLEKHGFPIDDSVDTVLLKEEREEWTSKKETRWAHIAQDYRILLLIGDNLGDVAEGIYDTPEARLAIVEDNRDAFGKTRIVIPNPLYGSFEGAAYGFNYGKPDTEKVADMVSQMDIWVPKVEEEEAAE